MHLTFIVIAIVISSSFQSLGLTIQRKSHIDKLSSLVFNILKMHVDLIFIINEVNG